MFKKADVILLALLIAAGLFASLAFARAGSGTSVVIKVAGKTFGTYDLSRDRTLLILADGTVQETDDTGSAGFGYNLLQIRDGQVSMIDADCHNQDCVHHKPINRAQESIICLPHKVVVEIQSQKGGGEYDTLSQ